MTVSPGDPAPDFTLRDQNDQPVHLAELRGRPVVLYFYPRADTPGCTTQACGVRDHRADYASSGAVVLGVSPDSVKAVKRFADKYALDFTLLADPDHSVAEAYGVWAQKSRYGRTYFGNLRTTFVIDAAGKVAHVLENVKPATHDEQVLAALATLRPD
jgi:peroxiredoxin Q/BCP